jgi:hypothetical protein
MVCTSSFCSELSKHYAMWRKYLLENSRLINKEENEQNITYGTSKVKGDLNKFTTSATNKNRGKSWTSTLRTESSKYQQQITIIATFHIKMIDIIITSYPDESVQHITAMDAQSRSGRARSKYRLESSSNIIWWQKFHVIRVSLTYEEFMVHFFLAFILACIANGLILP